MRYSIYDLQTVTENGQTCKKFTLFLEREDQIFHHIGRFTAPPETPTRELIRYTPGGDRYTGEAMPAGQRHPTPAISGD